MSAEVRAEELAASFDHYSPAQAADPYPLYKALREACPVAHADTHGGFWFTTSFSVVKQIQADYQTFSSAEGSGLPVMETKLLPIDLDPPQQTKYRKILNPAFTVEAIARHKGEIARRVNALIDDFIEAGEAELMGELIRPTLSGMVLPMLGIPLRDQPQITEWVDYMIRHRPDDPEGVMAKTQALAGYLIQMADARRGAEPQDDLLQVLIDGRIDGAPLSNDEIFRVLILLLFGGLDTTSAVMSEAIIHLSRHPDEAQALLDGHLAWGPAIEEFVRLTAPVQGQRRVATREVELGGVRIAAGQPIFQLYGAANRDPEHFAEPDRCVLDRASNDHVAFGGGAHICLGRNLARLEIEVLLDIVLRRLTGLAVPTDFKPEYSVGESRVMATLPVTFEPG